MGQWYGRNDQWPRHPEHWWREALPRAQAGGWLLDKTVGKSSHRWGKLKCRRPQDGDTDVCVIRVDTSGKGAENVARDVPKKMRNCPHRSDDPVSPAATLDAVRVKLEDATRLLDAVQTLLRQGDRMVEARALLEEAFEAAAGEAEDLLHRAIEQESLAADEVARLKVKLFASGAGETAASGFDAAKAGLDQADDELATVPHLVDGVTQAQKELARLRARANLLEERVTRS